jgi:Ca2+-transporting ATPase
MIEPAAQAHTRVGADVVAALDTDAAAGLADAEAARRLVEFGRNEVGGEEGPSRFDLLVDQFRSVLVWILIAAAVISGWLLGEWIDAGVIGAIVVLNAVFGYVQESRAEDALARLKELSAPEAVVLRDGRQLRVPSAEIVPGDVIVVEVGDRIAADARLLEGLHLEVDESMLTGESLPASKSPDPVGADAGLGDRSSMLFAATAVARGRGRAVVTGTGNDTEVGRIAEVLGAERPPTPLTIELDRVGKRLAALALGTAGLVFLTGLLRDNPAETMLLTAVALAVAAIPEGLPAVVTITLSGGTQRMAERNAVVRRLPAVEALGSASVICTDKTGTLTRNEIRVQHIVTADGDRAVDEADSSSATIRRFAEVASLCNDARPGDEGYLGDPTEVALLLAAGDLGFDPQAIRDRSPRIDEIAFDSRRKRMTTLHRSGDGVFLAVKGAPEEIVQRCASEESAGGVHPLDGARRGAILAAAERLAVQGLRTLAIAHRVVADTPADPDEAEQELTLVAVVGMSDESRPEAAPAVASARRAGITVVMVTGDHEVTARAIATEVGILEPGDEVMPGGRLREMSVDDLAAEVERYRVYARIDPLDKVKIVDAWQQRGEIVAMTGDGVNDAPALRAADIGVAMGSGTDVAKEASGMVLADDNFASIVAAVREGRSIFTNLKTVVYFLLSCNASEVLVMFFGFLLFGALGDPLLAVQLLWINLITDGLPALALGVDPPAPDVMERPPDRRRDILSGRRQVDLLRHGSVLAVATLASLVVGNYVMDLEWPVVRTMVFTTLVAVQLVHAYAVRARHTGLPHRGPGRNRLLALGALTSFILHLLVVYVPLGQTLFDTEPLPAAAWPLIAALTAASFTVVSLANWWLARRRGRGAEAVE